MPDHFLHRETRFLDLLERHADLTLLCGRELLALTQAEFDLGARARRITELAHEAHAFAHHGIERLYQPTRLPLGCGDVYRLITRLDDVVDEIEASSECITLYEITKITGDCSELAGVLVRAAEGITSALAGLRQQDPAGVLDRCAEIDRLEKEADGLLRQAVTRLFKSPDPIVVIKWKEIYEHLEAATDRCQDVATLIAGLIPEPS